MYTQLTQAAIHAPHRNNLTHRGRACFIFFAQIILCRSDVGNIVDISFVKPGAGKFEIQLGLEMEE